MRVHARLMMPNLSFKALMYALDVCMTVCRRTRACQECTLQFGLRVSQGQQNKLYEHDYVLKRDSGHDTKHKLC